MFQLGFYWHSLYAHFAYEVKRKDFWPLLLHHVVTIGLIYFSYVIGFDYEIVES
jgi:sphingoid base N-palmitoyltransferase